MSDQFAAPSSDPGQPGSAYGTPPPGNPPAPDYQGPYEPGPSNHPVQLTIAHAEKQSRALAIFTIPFFLIRLLLLIPTFIVLYVLSIALFVVTVIGIWAIAITGTYPKGMHDFATGVLRWNVRAGAYLYGLTDAYPPFRLAP